MMPQETNSKKLQLTKPIPAKNKRGAAGQNPREQEGHIVHLEKLKLTEMKYREFVKIPFVIIIIFLLSCNNNKQIKFGKDKWNEQADPVFPSFYRPQMLTDLTSNYKLVGVKYSQLIDLLGIPDYKDSSSLSYRIMIDYKHDIDPVYTRNLDFVFSKDSIIRSFKISEWNK